MVKEMRPERLAGCVRGIAGGVGTSATSSVADTGTRLFQQRRELQRADVQLAEKTDRYRRDYDRHHEHIRDLLNAKCIQVPPGCPLCGLAEQGQEHFIDVSDNCRVFKCISCHRVVVFGQ